MKQKFKISFIGIGRHKKLREIFHIYISLWGFLNGAFSSLIIIILLVTLGWNCFDADCTETRVLLGVVRINDVISIFYCYPIAKIL